jgi:hypothetical protein
MWETGPLGLVVGAMSVPAYSFRNTAVTSAAGAVLSTSIDIGPASGDRLVIVGTAEQGGNSVSSITVGSVSLSNVVPITGAGPNVEMWAGLVTLGSGPQTVTVTWAAGSFQSRGFSLWTANGLNSNSAKQTTSGTGGSGSTISVTAGDLMFAIAATTGASSDWSTSTQAPSSLHSILASGLFYDGADWTIAATNASFGQNPHSGITTASIAVTYR